MSEAVRVRLAALEDVPTIVGQRHAMFAEMGDGTPESLDRMDVGFAPWLVEKMTAGEYLGWFALDDDDQPVAGVGLWVQHWPVGPVDQTGRRAYLMNVYTEPHWRKRGLARTLVRVALDWSREQGLRTALLNASSAGRPVYESLGFRPSGEMRLKLD
jgi:GNAT superfamily N-acetyltransferase